VLRVLLPTDEDVEEVAAEHEHLVEEVPAILRLAAGLAKHLLDGRHAGALKHVGRCGRDEVEHLRGVRVHGLHSEEHARAHVHISCGHALGDASLRGRESHI